MAAVTVEEVRHVAMLARLGLTEEHAQALTRDLNTILQHMDALSRVDTRDVGEAPGTGAEGMRLRVDRGPPIALGEPPEAFGQAMRDGFFVVPRLATHGDAQRDPTDEGERA